MPPDPIDPKATRLNLGLTAGQAARLTGVDPRAWRRMETNHEPPRGPLQRLLRLILRLPGTLAALQAIADEDHAPPPDKDPPT